MSVGFRINLLEAGDATGVDFRWMGGRAAFLGWGTFDGATLSLEVSPDGTTWIPVPSVSLTANGFLVADVPTGVLVRAAVATAGATTDLNAALVHIDALP